MQSVALYVGDQRHVLEDSDTILGRANQALATLERYRIRLDEVVGTLSALEVEDLVTVRDVCTVIQRLEMVRRISEEIETYVVELGTDGRLLSLQLDELIGGVGADRESVVRDYVAETAARSYRDVEVLLASLDATELLDLTAIARTLGVPSSTEALDGAVAPHGHRLLSRVPRLPATIVDRLVAHFGGLQRLLAASVDELMMVEGVTELRARSIREGLERLKESSILERYV
jgi:diadenylate cyclase